MEELYLRFGERLRRARKQAPLTQEELAERLHLSRTTVVNIEKGRQRVALHQLLQIADAIGCDPVFLIPDYHQESSEPYAHGDMDEENIEFLERVRAQRRVRP